MIRWPGNTEFPFGVAAVEAAGIVLAYEDNEPKFNVQAAQAIVDAITLDQVKAWKQAQINAHAKALRDKVVAHVSVGEMASWSIKRDEAAKYVSDATPQTCPMLAREAQARGVTLGAIVQRVRANAQRFEQIEAAIGGADGKHRDAVAALTTFEAVAGYDYSTGWPGV